MKLLTFVCVCLIVECATECEEVTVETFENRKAEGTDITTNISRHLKNFTCAPTESVVHFTRNATDLIIAPEKILVLRCNECRCLASNLCMPTKKRNVTVIVKMKGAFSSGEKEVPITVSEHVNCECQAKNLGQERIKKKLV